MTCTCQKKRNFLKPGAPRLNERGESIVFSVDLLREYEAGFSTQAELAAKHGISRTTVAARLRAARLLRGQQPQSA